MKIGLVRWLRTRERVSRAGLWLFLAGIAASVASSVAGWSYGWELATIVLSYPGILLLLGSIALGDVAMLCILATRAPGKRGQWLSWLFLTCRGGALLLFFLLIARWEAQLLAKALSA